MVTPTHRRRPHTQRATMRAETFDPLIRIHVSMAALASDRHAVIRRPRAIVVT
jgi:hypothetical protein